MMIGKQIAHYRLTELIGIGGMGEVYKAADTRLDRVVALKILNEQAIDDEAKRQRFLQEARVASSLNHPNILTVHEVGQEQGYYFIATEYIEGETLRVRLQRGPLPLAEVLELGCQIAQALETAHRSGIIHRDIKPENIMLRPDGYIKVLDFGLAKLVEPKERHSQPAIKTDAGIVLGTVRYMSPEQIQHRPFDHRTDLFSLGIVLYEALTGRLPFNGQTIIDIAYEIVSSNPPPLNFSDIDPTAGRFTAVINRCLAKEALHRYSDATALLKD
jgi:eukaryotic-like serine/threonine-protein kinase